MRNCVKNNGINETFKLNPSYSKPYNKQINILSRNYTVLIKNQVVIFFFFCLRTCCIIHFCLYYELVQIAYAVPLKSNDPDVL